MLHYCDIEGWIGSKYADGVAGVCVASRWIDRGSQRGWSLGRRQLLESI